MVNLNKIPDSFDNKSICGNVRYPKKNNIPEITNSSLYKTVNHNNEKHHEPEEESKLEEAMDTAHVLLEVFHGFHEGHEYVAEMVEQSGSQLYKTAHVYHNTPSITDTAGKAAKTAGDVIATIAPIAAGVVGVYFAVNGAQTLQESIREKDGFKGIEAVSKLSVAAHSGIECGEFISKGLSSSVAAVLQSPLVATLGTAFTLTHGAADIVIGGKNVYDGIKTKDKKSIALGAADIGMGSAMIALTLGGGPLAAAGLGVLLLAKLGIQNRKAIKKGINKLLGKNKPEQTPPENSTDKKPETQSAKTDTPKVKKADIVKEEPSIANMLFAKDNLSDEQIRMKEIMEEHFRN